MKPSILITGATGNVGLALIKQLLCEGQLVRAAVISQAEAARLPDGVGWVRFDFTDPTTYADTFANVKKLFLMRPPQISNIARDMKPAIEFAAEAGVEQIVFLSLLGADGNRFVPHAKVEELLLAGTVPYTLLRCGFFMQNLCTTHREDIRDNDDIFIPAGSGRTAFIDVRDIAAVAARVLTEPGHEGKAYPLTGSEALDYGEVAALLTQVLKRPIRYSNPHFLRFAWRLWRQGQPLGYVAVVTAIYLTTRFGLAEAVTQDTAVLLNRPPISLHQFLIDHAPLWQSDGS